MELILTERERWHDRLDRYHYETHSPEYEKFAAEYGGDVTEEYIQQAWVNRRTELRKSTWERVRTQMQSEAK